MGEFEKILNAKLGDLDPFARIDLQKRSALLGSSSDWLAVQTAAPLAAPKSQGLYPRGTPAVGLDEAQLSLETQDALQAFRALGAEIPARFCEEHVRREWRRLARATHPDRNPGQDGTRFTRTRATYLSLVSRLRGL